MRATFTLALLASLATGIVAQSGSFDSFTDSGCSENGKTEDVGPDSSGTLPDDVTSIKADIPECALAVWVNGGSWYPLVVRPGDTACYELQGPGRAWNIVCD